VDRQTGIPGKSREDQEARVFRMVRKRFTLAERGVGINLLGACHDPKHYREDLFYCFLELALTEAP
jgi:hypothetical protein